MKNLFALLRLGLRTSTIEEESLSDFIMLSSRQWAQLGDIARKQGVLGIMLDGVDKLEATRYGFTRELGAAQKLEWIGEVLQMEQRNRQQMAVMEEMARKWTAKDCRVMVMKGQANGLLYPNPQHRSPGDIDCYLFNDNHDVNLNFDHNEAYRIGNELAREAGAKVDEGWYKHSVINYKGETFENHLFFVHTREGKRSKELQKELSDALKVDKWESFPNSQVLVPPVQWNAMFLTYHACGHFITEGLRLKQVLDWAMFLKKEQKRVDWPAFYDFCERHHLRIFADAATEICVKYLGVKLENPSIVANCPYTEKIVNSMLYDDDYIYNAGEGKWAGRIHLIKSIFKYRWKYEDIYQQSVWKQLWWYFTGFLFHTEKS